MKQVIQKEKHRGRKHWDLCVKYNIYDIGQYSVTQGMARNEAEKDASSQLMEAFWYQAN